MQIFPLFPNSEDAIIIYEKIGEDIMDSILEILLTGLMDPLIWIKSMSTLGLKKTKIQCIGAFFMCYMLVIGKSFAAAYVSIRAISTLLTILLAVYLFAATILLFEGRIREKILYVCMFSCITFVSELIVIGCCLFFKPDAWNLIMHNKIANLTCTLFAKALQILSCYWLFSRKKHMRFFYHNQKVVSLLIVICALVSDIILKNSNNRQSINAVLLFAMIEILLLWYIINFILGLKRKDTKIRELNQKVSTDLASAELGKDIDHFKHEFSTYVFIIKNLWYCKEYDKLNEYMDEVFKDVQKIELLFEHSNFTVRIIISGLIQMARKIGVIFDVRIDVKEFGMNDEDICVIFQNLVLNRLKEAVEVPSSAAHVELQVGYTDIGYEIQCIGDSVRNSDCVLELDEIVDKVVKKCNGMIEKDYIERNEKGYGLAKITIQIPLKS